MKPTSQNTNKTSNNAEDVGAAATEQSEFEKRFAQAEAIYLSVIEAKTPSEAVQICAKAIEAYNHAQRTADEKPEWQQQLRLALAKAYAQRGHQHRYQKNHLEAVKDLNKALELNPALADDYYYRARSYLVLGNEKAAKESLTEYLKRGEDEYLRHAAREQLDKLLPKKEDVKANLDYWRNQGTHFVSQASEALHPHGEEAQPDYDTAASTYNKAIEAFNKALEFAPNDMMTKFSLTAALRSQAECYQHLSEFDLAIADYNRLIEVQPTNAQAVFERGEIYRAAGHRDLAKNDFEQYLKTGKNPSSREQAKTYLDEKPKAATKPKNQE